MGFEGISGLGNCGFGESGGLEELEYFGEIGVWGIGSLEELQGLGEMVVWGRWEADFPGSSDEDNCGE